MSSTGRAQRAFPNNKLNRDWTLFTDSPGKGGGLCADIIGVDRNVIKFENSPFMVYNRLLVLKGFLSCRPYTKGPGSGGCPFSEVDTVDVHVAVSSSASLTEAQILAQDRKLPASWHTEDGPLIFDYRDREPDGSIGFIPQPTDAAYDGNTYLTLYWGDPNLVSSPNGTVPGDFFLDSFESLKEDFDERI